MHTKKKQVLDFMASTHRMKSSSLSAPAQVFKSLYSAAEAWNWSSRASLIHGTERAGTDRFRVLFHGTDLQSSKVTNLIWNQGYFGISLRFAGAASTGADSEMVRHYSSEPPLF